MLDRIAALFFFSLLLRIAGGQYENATRLYENHDSSWMLTAGGCAIAYSAAALMLFFVVTGVKRNN